MRAAIYARYSTTLQSAASIEDQLRICREFVARKGWTIAAEYHDAATSGATILRPGLQAMLTAARERRCDVVVAEALDRISRDLEDIAGIGKRLAFCGVPIVTLSEGEISPLHIGFKGTMSALFLKDLADKTHRGMRGRLEAGRAVAGIAYGYRVAGVGARDVVEAEAGIVRRIFAEYARGESPRAIACRLNAEGIKGPGGRLWSGSTIYGDRRDGSGILNNEAYIGSLVWNRNRFIKDPETRKRQARRNPPDAWLRKAMPAWRIVDDELWQAVLARQAALSALPLARQARPRHLFSGLVKCGCCGGGMSQVARDELGCTAARAKGSCGNRRTIKRREIETRVLRALEHDLLRPEAFALFCRTYLEEINRLRMEAGAGQDADRAELERVTRELDRAIDAILAGSPADRFRERMQQLEDRRTQLKAAIAAHATPPPFLHPSMAARFRAGVAALTGALSGEAAAAKSAQGSIRALVERIVVKPADAGEKQQVDLVGDIGGILALAAGREGRQPALADGLSAPLVAGHRTQRLRQHGAPDIPDLFTAAA